MNEVQRKWKPEGLEQVISSRFLSSYHIIVRVLQENERKFDECYFTSWWGRNLSIFIFWNLCMLIVDTYTTKSSQKETWSIITMNYGITFQSQLANHVNQIVTNKTFRSCLFMEYYAFKRICTRLKWLHK